MVGSPANAFLYLLNTVCQIFFFKHKITAGLSAHVGDDFHRGVVFLQDVLKTGEQVCEWQLRPFFTAEKSFQMFGHMRKAAHQWVLPPLKTTPMTIPTSKAMITANMP